MEATKGAFLAIGTLGDMFGSTLSRVLLVQDKRRIFF